MPIEIGIGGAVAPQDRITLPWADTRKGTTQAVIETLRVQNFLGRNIVGYASASDCIGISGVAPPLDGTPKYWRDNAAIWTDKPYLYYAFPQRDANGNFVPLSPKPSGFSERDETFNFMGPTVQKYLTQHSRAIGSIPKLILLRVRSAGARRMSFEAGIPFDFPIGLLIEDPEGPIHVNERADGSVWAGPTQSGPSATSLRIANPMDGSWFPRLNESGTIEFCKIQGFAADDDVAAGGASLSDSELADAAEAILSGPGNRQDKGAAIRRAARG